MSVSTPVSSTPVNAQVAQVFSDQKAYNLDRYSEQLGGTSNELTQAARDFEALFLSQLMKEMMPKDGSFFGKEQGSQTFQSFFIDSVTKQMSSRDVLGLKTIFQQQYLRDKYQPVNETNSEENHESSIARS